MIIRKKVALFIAIIFSIFITFSCAYSKPPRPGPNFHWVKPIKTKTGQVIPGHWINKGRAMPGKVWVPTHLSNSGEVIPGQWKVIKPAKKKSVWVPGHHGPRGRWIPGHWK